MGNCNHDVNSNETTLKILNRKFLIVPNTKLCICIECNKKFNIKKNKDGVYVLKEVKGENF